MLLYLVQGAFVSGAGFAGHITGSRKRTYSFVFLNGNRCFFYCCYKNNYRWVGGTPPFVRE